MSKDAFSQCKYLKVIYVAEECDAGLFYANLPAFTKVGPPPETTIRGVRVWGLRSLKSVVIPDGAERVGAYWFCRSLIESVEIPASVVEIGTCAFHNCLMLKRLVFRGAGARTKLGRALLARLTERSRLKKIGKGAFSECSGLKSVQLPDGLEEIGIRAFANSGLESIVTPQSVRTIRRGAFCNCGDLKKAVLNEGLEVLGTEEKEMSKEHWSGVFQGSALETVKLPSTLKRIECKAFRSCASLKRIDLPEKLEYIGMESFSNSGLQSVTFPKALKVVGQGAFSYCKSLRTVVMNEGLKILGTHECKPYDNYYSGVFSNSAIESVKLPSTLKKVGYTAF